LASTTTPRTTPAPDCWLDAGKTIATNRAHSMAGQINRLHFAEE
jgi:hypothetical protein